MDSPNLDFTSAGDNFKETHPETRAAERPGLKDVLREALDELRKEMRARVGRKLLSVEVHSHADDEARPT